MGNDYAEINFSSDSDGIDKEGRKWLVVPSYSGRSVRVKEFSCEYWIIGRLSVDRRDKGSKSHYKIVSSDGEVLRFQYGDLERLQVCQSIEGGFK